MTVSLKTALVIGGDASGAVAALDATEQGLQAAEKEAQAFEKAHKAASGSIEKLAKAQAEATAEIAQAKAAYKANEIGLADYNRSVLETKSALSLVRAEYSGSMRALKAANDDYVDAVKRNSNANDEAVKSTRLAGHHVQNLAFQFNDLAVQLASGANPMMAFVQQGSQIGGVMAQAGIGVRGLAMEILALAAPFVLIIAAAAALAVGVALVTDEVNKNSGVAVSWQNVVLGAFDAAKEFLTGQLSAAFGSFGVTAGEVWDFVKAATKGAVNFMIATNLAVPRLIAATYSLIGPAIGDAFYSGANLAIEGLNFLIGKAAGAVNGLVDIFNDVFGTNIPKAATEGIAKIANPYAGAMSALGSAGAKSLVGTFKADYVGNIADAVGGAAIKRQLAENAEKAGKDAGKSAGKATGAALKKAAQDEAKGLFADFEPVKLDTLVDFEGMVEEIARVREFNAELQKVEEQKAAEALKEFNTELENLRDIAGDLDFGSIFGDGGNALDGMLGSLERLTAAREEYDDLMKKAGADEAKRASVEAAYDKAKLNGTVALLGQTKRLFSEQSAGYKAVEAAEKAAAAIAAVNTIKHVAAGASKIFGQLGAFGFPVVAAMVGVMAGLGFSGGSSAAIAPPSPEELQASIGTGTVLGDNGAQSESIANALEILAGNSNSDLEYSNEQVRYLREISAGIGNLTSQIARQVGLGAGGMFSTSGLNLGTSGSSGVLGLFGSSTTRTLYDQGIETFNQQIGDILAAGVEAQIYNVVQTVKKKSGFLGLGGGTSTSYTTTTGAIDNTISRQFGLIVGDLQKSITGMIVDLADNSNAAFRAEVENYINNLVLPGTKLSFEGMSGDEIEEALSAYFSSVADTITKMASGLALPDLAAFQQAGEGLYETLARLTRTIATVNVSLKSIGMSAGDGFNGDISVTGRATAATNLSDQFGGLDAMQEAISAFSETFLTEAERMAPVISSVREEMARLGASGVTTNEQFKQLVQGLDLSTESGQSMFAQLLAVAPAFAKVTEYLGDLNAELVDGAKTAAELKRVADERYSLEGRLLQLQGDTAALRAREREKLDESNRALFDQINALEDAKAAAQALADATAEQARIAEQAAAEQVRLAEEAAAQVRRVADERFGLETRLLQLQGNTAALRERELAAIDPANRSLLQAIFAFEDAQAAAQAFADAQAEQARIAEEAAAEQRRLAEEAAALARRIADERFGLETRLLQLQGNTAALRERELAALDPTNRALLQSIFAIEDARVAAQDLADAQAEQARMAEQSAAEQRRLAEEAAALARRIADERFGLETRLLQLQGNTAALRERELAALDPTNRAILESIFAIEDARVAAQKLADAQAEQARIAEEAAADQRRLAEEAATLAARIADERYGLETRLLQAQGDTAKLRERELAALDPTNRALLGAIFAIEDARVAAQELADAQAEQARIAEQSAADQRRLAEEAAALAARIADERFGLETRLLQLQGNTIALRERELAALDPANRALLQTIFAFEDAEAAARALADQQAEQARIAEEAAAEQRRLAEEAAALAARIADERFGLETRLLELQGNTAALRERELAALDPTNRALLEAIFAIEDARVAAQELADAQAEQTRIAEEAAAEQRRLAEEAAALAARIADERFGLETRLLQLQGDTIALRERELAALDPANRALLQTIFAFEDAQAAAQVLAEQQAEQARMAEQLAAEQRRIAEEAAALAARIADERFGLETRLLQLQGDTVALRERELAALDPTNRALLQTIFAFEDAQAAAQALADAQAEQARMAEEAAAQARRIADERFGLETRLLQLQGNTAALRERELAALDPSNRQFLLQIYAIEDAQAAMEDATAAIEKQSSAYRDMINEHRSAAEVFGRLADQLRQYRRDLTGGDLQTSRGYSTARSDFEALSQAAANGDQAAIGGLSDAGNRFLEASRANSRSLVDYQRDVARVVNAVDAGLFAAETRQDWEEVQAEALERQIDLLKQISINTAASAAPQPGGSIPSGPAAPGTAGTVTVAGINDLLEQGRVQSTRTNELLTRIDRLLNRVVDVDAVRVTAETTDPLPTKVIA